MDFGVISEFIKGLFALLYEKATSFAEPADKMQENPNNHIFQLPHDFDQTREYPEYYCDHKQLRVIPREEWTAHPPMHDLDRLELPAQGVIVHHTATRTCATTGDCKKFVRQIQTFHMESNGWDDIGYNFLIGNDGTVYEGRGWDYVGAHTKGYNKENFGIALMGTFTSDPPTPEQMDALQKLIRQGVAHQKLSKDYKLYPHSHFADSQSPGEEVVEVIQKWPRYVRNKEDATQGKDRIILRLLKRDDWLARTPKRKPKTAATPISNIIVTETETELCLKRSACMKVVRSLQTLNIESQGLDDIAYNFLVGGDGIVYEGRGWDYLVSSKGRDKDTYTFALVGTFDTNRPTDSQMIALQKILDEGVQLNKVSKKYKINPAKKTLGKKALKLISDWPQFGRNGEDATHLREIKIVPRSKWLGASARLGLRKLEHPVPFVFVHHSGTRNCSEMNQCIARIRKLRDKNISQGSKDINYNFLVGGDGTIYEGRGWLYTGNHTKGHNKDSIGIALMGTFDSKAKIYPNKAQVKASQTLLEKGVKNNYISKGFNVRFTVR